MIAQYTLSYHDSCTTIMIFSLSILSPRPNVRSCCSSIVTINVRHVFKPSTPGTSGKLANSEKLPSSRYLHWQPMMRKRLQAWYAAEVQKQLKKNVAHHMSCMHAWIDILFRTCSHCYAGCILCILTALASFAEMSQRLRPRCIIICIGVNHAIPGCQPDSADDCWWRYIMFCRYAWCVAPLAWCHF